LEELEGRNDNMGIEPLEVILNFKNLFAGQENHLADTEGMLFHTLT